MVAFLVHTATVTLPLLLVPTAILLAALRWGREGFRSDYPADVQAAMPGGTRAARLRGGLLGAAFLLALLAVLTVSAHRFLTAEGSGLAAGYGVALLGMLTFVVIDLVVVDWGVICAWRPRWVVAPGTEDCAGWGDYAFHARELVQAKAVAANLLLPLPLALLAWWLA